METAGRTLDDRELAEAMKERGLGTPATRAEIIETLVRREYVERQGRSLCATDKGIGLVERVHPDVKSPALTGEWEARASRASSAGRPTSPASCGGSRPTCASSWRRRSRARRAATRGRPRSASQTPRPRLWRRGRSAPDAWPGPVAAPAPGIGAPRRGAAAARPRCSNRPEPVPQPERLHDLLRAAFRLEAFRPRQEAVCRAVAEGKDVLLVMPTGAGKSLCYQLPGLARGGTTLVVSPLIALMEDQVAKLQALGLRAERIHSGRDRALSRAGPRAPTLDGRLDFLFVAPERLGVPGFPEALARRTPALVAVDEAHCISEWGHDFRPDYRLLGARLPQLRPAPVIALTATATPRVQDDIAAQLGARAAAVHPRVPAREHRDRGGAPACPRSAREAVRASSPIPARRPGDRVRAHAARGRRARGLPCPATSPPPPTTRG